QAHHRGAAVSSSPLSQRPEIDGRTSLRMLRKFLRNLRQAELQRVVNHPDRSPAPSPTTTAWPRGAPALYKSTQYALIHHRQDCSSCTTSPVVRCSRRSFASPRTSCATCSFLDRGG